MPTANVFHNQNSRSLFCAEIGDYDPDDYKLVAEVSNNKDQFSDDHDFLEYVYERTNSTFRYWGENKGVNDFTGKNRSTSVGDVIELNGSKYMVSSVGFEKLTSQNCPHIVA